MLQSKLSDNYLTIVRYCIMFCICPFNLLFLVPLIPPTSTPSPKRKAVPEKKMTPLSKCLYNSMTTDPLGMFLDSVYCVTRHIKFYWNSSHQVKAVKCLFLNAQWIKGLICPFIFDPTRNFAHLSANSPMSNSFSKLWLV